MSPSKVSLLNKFGFAGVALLSIILAAGVLTAGAWLVKEKADQMVSSQAEQIALDWATYLGGELDRIEEIASGAETTPAETEFLNRVRIFGDVFRFKLFDSAGRIRLISDDLANKLTAEASLGKHNPKAASVVETGKPYTVLADGTKKADRPDVYVESYVPVIRNGRAVAIAEAYVDQTRNAAAIQADFREFGVKILSLTLLTLLVPFAGLIWMMAYLRRQNAQLEEERNKAQGAERAKSEFLANMSHEIRTPLNGVLGMAGLLIKTPLTDEQKEYNQTIIDSGESLLTILNDVLDFSKIEAGKMDLERSVFEPLSLIDSTVTLLASQAHGKGLEIPTCVEHDVPKHVVGDDGRVRQVLLNLVGNAIKFTRDGGVSVNLSMEQLAEDQKSCFLRFDVRDTGIGISEEGRKKLFDKFYQVDGSHRRNFEGTGLGLAISKRLVEMMGGEISVESAEGEGSLFSFTIKAGLREETDGWAENLEASVHGRRILVVDDNPVNRTIFEKQLEELGARVTTAISADAALSKIQLASESGAGFDLAIIDHCMPGTDGFDLAKMIRNEPDGASLKLILSSSAGQFNSDVSVQRFGFNACLPKPLRPGALLKAAARVFDETGETAPLVSAPLCGPERPAVLAQEPVPELTPIVPENVSEPVSGGKTRILVAEDNHVNQKVMRTMLEQNGYDVQLVSNGVEAVDAVRKYKFDLVLMDISMPEMDGLIATRRIRELREEASAIPIIGVTANAMKGDRERVIQAGMNDYVTKPVDADVMFGKIGYWLNQAGSAKTDPLEANLAGGDKPPAADAA